MCPQGKVSGRISCPEEDVSGIQCKIVIFRANVLISLVFYVLVVWQTLRV